jgi:hypothetical protein
MAGGPALERERGGTYDTDIDITVIRGELMELRQQNAENRGAIYVYVTN